MSMFYELMMKKKGMPSRYQEVEYIESTGTQYIDTGISGVCSFEIIVEGTLENSVSQIVIGRDVTASNYFGKYGSRTTWGIGNDVGLNNFVESYLSKQTFTINFNDGSISTTCNGVTKSTTGTSSLNKNVYLFRGNSATPYSASCRYYSAKCTQNNRLVRNFIPVYDTLTQKYGMWESVQGKFYGNDGTGDFGGSIVGYTIVGSPTESPEGVFSGLTQSNYIKLSEKIQNIDWQNLHIHTEFEVSSLPSTAVVFCIGAYNIKFNVRSGNYLYFQYRALSAPSALQTAFSNTSVIPLNSNITVELDCIKDTSAHLVVKSGTNILWEFSTSDFTINGNDDFLYGTDITYFGGNNLFINLNNTYIKINNKLWFNGQQA